MSDQNQVNAPVVEQLRPEGWSEQDIAWLNNIQPEVIRPVAIRYKRKLFAITWQALQVGESLFVLSNAIQSIAKWGHKKQVQMMLKACNDLLATSNRMLMDSTTFAGHTFDEFKSCKEDIERAITLAQAAPSQVQGNDKVSPGGILLQ